MEVRQMEQFIGKRCKILIDFCGNILVYTARIESVTPSHVSFCDRYDKRYAFNNKHIIEIEQLGGD